MTSIVLCSRFVLALLALLLTLPAAWGRHGPGYTPPPGNCNTGCTLTPSTVVTTLITAVAQDAAGELLTAADPSGLVVGQTATSADSHWPAGTVNVIATSAATAAVTLTVPAGVPTTANFIPVSSNTGLKSLMMIHDTTTGGAVPANAFIAGVYGGTNASSTSVTGTAGATGASVITVSSGGTGCAAGMLVLDATTPSVISQDTTVIASTATTVTISNVIVTPGVGGSDTINCYPNIYLSTPLTGAVLTSDSLTLTPGFMISGLTTGVVPSGTTINFGPTTTQLGNPGVVSLGSVSGGFAGLYVASLPAFRIYGNSDSPGSSGNNGPTDVLAGLGAGASLPPNDFESTALGWHALFLETASPSESTAVGYNSQSSMTTGGYNTSLGISTISQCKFCVHDISIGTDSMRNVLNASYVVAIGINSVKDSLYELNVIGIGQGAWDGGATSSGLDNIGIGLNAGGGSQRTTAQKNVCIGDLSCGYNSITSGQTLAGVGNGVFGKITTGTNSVAIGASAGAAQTTQSANTFVGGSAGAKATSGTGRNTCIGASVCSSTLTTGSDNIVVGNSSNADVASGSTSDFFLIQGNGATPIISATGINATPAISFGGTLTATAISTAGTIAGSICMTSGNLFLYESGATGCTISLEELKHDIAPLGVRTGEFMALNPISFGYNDPTMPQKRLGFGAHQVFGVDPALSTFDGNGKLQAYDPDGVLALTVAVVQRQVWEIRALAVVCVLLVLWCAGLTTAMMRTGHR